MTNVSKLGFDYLFSEVQSSLIPEKLNFLA